MKHWNHAEPEPEGGRDDDLEQPRASPPDDRDTDAPGGSASSGGSSLVIGLFDTHVRGALPTPEKLGDYELLEVLGAGGMGVVYRARHVRLDRMVALKLLKREHELSQHALARFEREMKALGRLDHPNLVEVLDARRESGRLLVAMRLVDGKDLAAIVSARGRLAPADACEVIRQAALGLAHAHEHGVVHRDVKPGNIMLARGGKVKVLDVGLALLRGAPAAGKLTQVGDVMGTADYMAPEQFTDPASVDSLADVYSLGATLYHLLAGEAPFSGPEHCEFGMKIKAHLMATFPPVRQRAPEVSEDVEALLGRMVAKRPDERCESMLAVAAALEPFASGAALGALVEALLPRATPSGESTPRRYMQPRSGRRALIVAAATLLAGGAVLWRAISDMPEGSLSVSTLELNHFAGGAEPALIGTIGVDSFEAQTEEIVRVRVVLNAPAYAYLVAFNTDGTEQLCYPADKETPPPPTASVQFPPQNDAGFAFSDGAGLQAFAVIASRRPLPPYSAWRRGLAAMPWRHVPATIAGVWRSDGTTLTPLKPQAGTLRGNVVPLLSQSPQPFAQLCEAIYSHGDVEAFAALAFPVAE